MARQLGAFFEGLSIEKGLTEDGAYIVLPGFCDAEYTDHGILKLWKLSSLFEVGRVLSLRTLNLGNMSHYLRQPDRSMFVRSIHYTIDPELTSPGLRTYTSKVTQKVRLLDCGNTSFSMEQLIQREDGFLLASIKLTYVYVNLETRKAMALPLEVRKQFASRSQETARKYVHPDIPAQCVQSEVVVEPHLIDGNGHTNQSRYVQFCCDAASAAASRDLFRGTTLAIKDASDASATLRVKDMITMYEGESLEGDHLSVFTWPDKVCKNCIYFTIVLGNKQIFHSRWYMYT